MIFEVRDASGRMIRLTRNQFAHIAEHSLLAGKLEEIKETVMHPNIILQSLNDSTVNYYFRFYKELGLFLLVVIKYLNGDGFVITAYYTHKRTQ